MRKLMITDIKAINLVSVVTNLIYDDALLVRIVPMKNKKLIQKSNLCKNYLTDSFPSEGYTKYNIIIQGAVIK